MGYKFQFVTLAGFHALNLSMFELARGCTIAGMTAYSRLQEREFSRETLYGYEAVKHQRFVARDTLIRFSRRSAAVWLQQRLWRVRRRRTSSWKRNL